MNYLMQKNKPLFFLLTLCVVLFMTSCNNEGGSSSKDDDKSEKSNKKKPKKADEDYQDEFGGKLGDAEDLKSDNEDREARIKERELELREKELQMKEEQLSEKVEDADVLGNARRQKEFERASECVVKVSQAYFYSQPDPATRKKAYLVKNDRFSPIRVSNNYVYVEFYSAYLNATTKGWINMDDVAIVE